MNHPFQDEVKLVRPNPRSIDPLILDRWSPRSMTGEEITDDDLKTLFEAARWAPSSYNGQPWKFLYAKRNTDAWPLFFDLMIDFNKGWTKNAAVLLVVLSAKNFEHNNKPSTTHSFDTGAAWMALALEAARRGYVAHGMEGFDYEKARKNLDVPDDHRVEAMVAIGKRAPIDKLPKELQEREKPSERKAVEAFAFEGKFRHLRK